MTKQITATIVFTLHEDIVDQLQDANPKFHEKLILDSIVDCLEDERVGVSQYKSSKVSVTNILEVEAVD